MASQLVATTKTDETATSRQIGSTQSLMEILCGYIHPDDVLLNEVEFLSAITERMWDDLAEIEVQEYLNGKE